MSARVIWSGLDELRAQLRTMPADLTAEASSIVREAAHSATTQIQAAYPTRTGNLRSHVKVVTLAVGAYGAGFEVKSTAKHADLFESGTQARHTSIGANRGAMPAGHVFIPIVIRKRRAMYAALEALLRRHELEVTGV